MLEIKTFKDPILRKKCLETELTDEVRNLIVEMKETMYVNNGIGLAAPQVGVSKRIIVIDVGFGPIVLINPVITNKKGKAISDEGCLSFPGIFGKVKRFKNITVEAINEEGKKIKIEASEMLSFCIQHEVDHLDGILFIDKLRFLDRLKQCLKKR